MKKVITRNAPENIVLLHKHPLLNRIYAARGVTDPAEFDYDLKHLLSYASLKGIEQAVACLTIAIQEQQHVLIVGDFDAD